MSRHSARLVCGLLATCAGLTGFTTASTTNTARTATEQLLISNSVDGALDKVNFTPFAGSNVYIEEKYVDGVDSKYLIASVRHRVLHAGGRLVDKPENADAIVELRSGGIGTTTAKSFIGTPELSLPGMLTIPEVRLIERSRQSGTAKIGLVAYTAGTKEILGTGGVTLDRADDNNWFVAGVGPWQSGSVREEIEVNTAEMWVPQERSIPRQVAFEGARRLPPEEQAKDIRYASFPKEPNAAPAVSPK
jgi:hypothetical protein